DLLSPDIFRLYTARPERLREIIQGNPGKDVIIIDEIQKVPSLLDVVHQIIEEKTGKRFILTGSSARKLKRSGVDLLAGRALYKTFHPFMASELKNNFSIDSALQTGLLPLVFSSARPAEVLNSYISLYLNQEVLAESLVRNIGGFARFLEAVSFSHASVMNLSSVARDCGTGRKTAEGYVSILEDLLLSFSLPVFSKRAKRQLISHSKFYFFDSGVYRSIRPAGPLDNVHEIDGSALEGLVAQHLTAWNSYSGNKYGLYFWRTKSGVEVDFIIYGPDMLTAIEVKNSDIIRSRDLKGLRSFKEDYPEASALLLYRGREKMKTGDIMCMPCDEFLSGLVPGKGFDSIL
ncbi:MAG: ATP-binding protein, partial [Candidatus Aureabacteria bacterium]|nr:ATP-binding protein [Candidatus Auribacterota bacterium]